SSTEFTYDSGNADRLQQGNQLQMRRLPGPRGGDQAQIVNSMTYESNFNFVRNSTDGRGNVTTYSCDARGNITNIVHRVGSIIEYMEYNVFGQLSARVLPDNGNGYHRRDVMSYYSSGPQ